MDAEQGEEKQETPTRRWKGVVQGSDMMRGSRYESQSCCVKSISVVSCICALCFNPQHYQKLRLASVELLNGWIVVNGFERITKVAVVVLLQLLYRQ